ncbi:hypothetical protein [Planktosalinus lacus]|nr:hypothetical protein [Planktosalinus lacus]
MNKIPDSWKKKLETDTNISNINEYILDIISEADKEMYNKLQIYALDIFNFDIENNKLINDRGIDSEALLQATQKAKNDLNYFSKDFIFSIYNKTADNNDLFINELCRYLYSLNSPMFIKGSLESLKKSLANYMYHKRILSFHYTFSNHLKSKGFNVGFPDVTNIESFLYKKQENEKKDIERKNQDLKDEIEELKKQYYENLNNAKTDFQNEIELIKNKYKSAEYKISELEAKLMHFYNGDIFRATVFGSDYPKLRKIYDFLFEHKLIHISPTSFYFNTDINSDGVLELYLLSSDFTQEDLGCFLHNLRGNFPNHYNEIDKWFKNRLVIRSKRDRKRYYNNFEKYISPYSDSVNKPEFYKRIMLFFGKL